ncbi:hypothetical protein BY996DRAFT_4573288 [Phakopsora pachyrhizi]|uniref:Mediator of RNA polymerase II transcription subunit 18 n=1 Tax=Phakopsora pachyrhizi TaxID=170000 RepID=A0AAV0BJV6_PHAPC|nr:hypothetical protein BY996DRAFT_4573288 [Phakopsora pachyrhizi]CAH7686392.1 hypothetical protein PPACK8108_LOCUS21036 [Phakopsora pachyrhizi]
MGIQVSVSGIVPADLQVSVLDRLSNYTHSASQFHAREVVFDRGPLESNSEDSNLLRFRHVDQINKAQGNDNKSTSWSLVSLGRPERERISPDFLIRPIFSCPILDGDPMEFASALGYWRKFEFYKRGVAFTRGVVVVELFQLFETETTPVGWPEVTLITITATVSGSRATGMAPGQVTAVVQQQESRSEGCNRVREMQAVLKGLVDLGRVEPF